MTTNPGPYESLLDKLDLDERAVLTAGHDDWNTQALPDHGVPAIRVTDGPVGARGQSFTSVTAALFPCGSALGATFDPALVGEIGAALGDEARTKQAHVLLGPTLNLHRHPLGGRNFESYGEDPLLVSRLAVAFVRGVQSRGVGSCPKHFVANDAEIERMTISSDVDERVLREVYLRPFEAAVREGGAWTIMASYNRINGIYGCEHRWLLTDVLMSEWGFDGVVISDWFATHSTDATLLAGVHLEMPGPARHLGSASADAVRERRVPADVVDDAARPRAATGRPGRRVDRAILGRASRGRPGPVGARRTGECSVDGLAPEPVDRLRCVRRRRPAVRSRPTTPRRHRSQCRGGRGPGRGQRSRPSPPHGGTARRAAGAVPRDRRRVCSGRVTRLRRRPTRRPLRAQLVRTWAPHRLSRRARRAGGRVVLPPRGQPDVVGPRRRRHRFGAIPRDSNNDADRPPDRPASARARQRGRMHPVDGQRGDPAHRSVAVVEALLRVRDETGRNDGRSRRRRAAPSRGELRPPGWAADRRLPHPHRGAHRRGPDRRCGGTCGECRRRGRGGRHGRGHRVRGLRSADVRTPWPAGRACPPRGGGQPAHGRRGERRRRGRPPVARRRGRGAAHVVPRHGRWRGARRRARR